LLPPDKSMSAEKEIPALTQSNKLDLKFNIPIIDKSFWGFEFKHGGRV